MFFPLKLPLKAKGKIRNVFSQTLKSVYDTPIPATDILWFDSRSCCSLLPCTPQYIRSSSGLGFAACSPVPPGHQPLFRAGLCVPPFCSHSHLFHEELLLWSPSCNPAPQSLRSFFNQVGCKVLGMPSDHRQHFICQEYIFILVKEALQIFYSHYQSDW